MIRPLWVLLFSLGILSTSFLLQPDQIGAIANYPHTTQISLNQLQEEAILITVKILSSRPLGSGILIREQDSIYTVLTNDHVLLTSESPYQVQTFDRKIHQAKLIERKDSLENNDLAILQFQSADHQYKVAQIGVTPKLEEPVFAAGFPLPTSKWESKKPFARPGQVEWVLKKALKNGYQVGYSSKVERGMSGGPLLNRAGQVVSINGWRAHPPLGERSIYIYQDGSEPSSEERERMKQYSWGIPIETFLELELRKSQTQESQ